MRHYGVKCHWLFHTKLAELGDGAHLAKILHQGLDNLGFLCKWVSCGTMLGLHRDGRFISTDSDIDVSVLGGINKQPLIAAMEPWELIREGTYDGQIQQLAFVTPEGVLFDVNCFYLEGDELVNHAPHKDIRKPASLFFPIVMWKDSPVGDIPVPNDLDAYCEMRYGSSWRIPSSSKGIYGWKNERNEASVATIIPSRGKTKLLRDCLDSMKEDLEVVVVEQGTSSKKMLDERHINRIEVDCDKSYSEMNNMGVAVTSSEFVLLMNNDVEAMDPFVSLMLEEFTDDEVGIVGARLLFPDGTLQHGGIRINANGIPYHPDIRITDKGNEYTDAVTFACAMVRRATWDDVGGLDEDYFFNYEDVDFCLSARKKGWKIRMSKAVLMHHHAASASFRTTQKHTRDHNYSVFRRKWPKVA